MLVLVALGSAPGAPAAEPRACATFRQGSRNLSALHRYDAVRGALRAAGDVADQAPADRDVDDIALLEDRGDLVAWRHPLDLAHKAVRLVPNAAAGFDPTPVGLGLETGALTLALGNDDAVALELPFTFPFFGVSYTRAFVHSDGTLSFGRPDALPADRGLGSLLAGPPRIAPFFADLSPESSGRIAASVTAERALVSWSDVPGAGSADRNSFSVVLHADGTIDMVYGDLGTGDAVAGVTPGDTTAFVAADFSQGEPRGRSGALVEGFSKTDHLDLVATVQRFLTSHPDIFEQVVIYTTRPLNPQPESLAFQVNVRNEVRGIGLEVHDDARDWGSGGALASVVYMDAIDVYRDVDGFEILGHEVGHRWLARLRFRSLDGAASGALLGRSGVHWSFFLDSDASLLEGNEIADLGGGRFETTAIVDGFSSLDLYAMGLASEDEVPPFFYVAEADDFQPARTFKAASGPELGVRFTGVRHDVTLADVIAAEGRRQPSASEAPRRLRQAFVLVADAEAPASQERLATVARIRSRFGPWYAAATRGRGSADSTLPQATR
jgi:hypothetical protein